MLAGDPLAKLNSAPIVHTSNCIHRIHNVFVHATHTIYMLSWWTYRNGWDALIHNYPAVRWLSRFHNLLIIIVKAIAQLDVISYLFVVCSHVYISHHHSDDNLCTNENVMNQPICGLVNDLHIKIEDDSSQILYCCCDLPQVTNRCHLFILFYKIGFWFADMQLKI